MKRKNLLHGLSVFLLLTLVCLGYLFLFLFPALVDINRCRREINDLQLKMGDYARTRQVMVFPDQAEREMLKQIRRKFRKFVSVVKDSQSMNVLLGRVSHFIRSKVAAREVQKFRIEIPGSPSRSFSSRRDFTVDELQIFSGFRKNTGKEGKPYHPFHPVCPGDGPLLSQLGCREIILGFSGGIEQSTALIYELFRSDFPLWPENIRISAKGDTPFFLVGLGVFFREENKDKIPSPSINGNRSTGSRSPEAGAGTDEYIDFNSPLLLVPVSRSRVPEQQKQELPKYSKGNIFVLNRR